MGEHAVTIVILTWNGLQYTKRCIETLRCHTTHPDYRVTVVDNGSSDGTLEYLRQFPDISVIANPENMGFVRANNQAIEQAPPEHDIVLINNDIEIPAEQTEWLARLQRTAYSAPDIGVVGCRLRRPNGMLQHAGAYMPLNTFWGQQIGSEEKDINQYPFIREVESVVFACVYIKRAVINKIGGLSKDYFAYFEDTDYCLSAREAGYRTVCSGDVTIVHHENVSTRENKVSHSELFTRSQAIFRKKWAKKLESKYTRQLVWLSTVSRPHGYAMTSKDMLLELERRNVEVTYRYLYGRGTVFPVDEPDNTGFYQINAMKHRSIPAAVPHVVYGQGDAFAANHGPYKIGFTMLEVSGIPAEWVRQANLMDEVWVPTEFNRETFSASGVRVPIHVMPLGVDTNYFNPWIASYPICDDYKFLAVFEWGERKAPEMLIKTFNETFSADEPVLLLCKANCTDPSVDVRQIINSLNLSASGGRVEFIMSKYSPYYQLGSLYRSTDCFVLTSRGEGWGMPILEAMACGLPTISTYWSAPTAFMTEANSFPLQVKRLINAVAKCPYYAGLKWADPDPEHLRHLLRYVFEHQDEARAKGARAAADVAGNWTIAHCVDRILTRLEQIGSAGPGRAPQPATARVHSPARVAVDVSRAIGEQITGAGRYAQSVVDELAAAQPDDMEFILLPGFGSFVHPEYGRQYRYTPPRAERMTLYRGPLPAFSSRETVIPDVDLLHSTAFMMPEYSDPATRLVVTVLDVTFITHPMYHVPENIAFCRANLEKALQREVHFIAISESTKRDLMKCCHVPDERVSVVYISIDTDAFRPRERVDVAAVRAKHGLPERFVLFVGSIEPRKNLATLLDAYAQRPTDWPLIVCGANGWMNAAIKDKIAAMGAAVRVIGYVPDAELPLLYNAAGVFVFPTHYEGFGMPVLEAMACGTPVITSRVSSLPEVGGTAAVYTSDPANADELAHALRALTADPDERERRRALGLQQATRFARTTIAADLLAVYRRLLGTQG